MLGGGRFADGTQTKAFVLYRYNRRPSGQRLRRMPPGDGMDALRDVGRVTGLETPVMLRNLKKINHLI
jgi:hypothetical protein